MDARREAVAPKFGVLKWLLRHRRCRPMTASGSGASSAQDGRPVTRGMLPVAIAGVVVVCRYGACGMTNDTCFIHCALSDDCRATAHCNSSLGVSTSTYRISTSLVCAPGIYPPYTCRRQVWRLHLALQRRPSRRPSSAGTFCAAEATSTRRTSAQQPPCRRPAHWSCAPPVLLEPLQLCSRFESQHLHIGPSSQLGSCLNRHPTRQ